MKVAAVRDTPFDERAGAAELRNERVRTVDPVKCVDLREVVWVDAVKRGQLTVLDLRRGCRERCGNRDAADAADGRESRGRDLCAPLGCPLTRRSPWTEPRSVS
jgi:hypothetical protein